MTTPAHTPARRRLSPALFAAVAFAFVLPFGTVSCDGATTHTTGIQLVTRTVPDGGKLDWDECTYIGQCVEHNASNWAVSALFIALVGLGLGLRGIVRGPGWCGLLGAGAMVGMVLEGMFAEVSLDVGWVIAFFGFLAAAVLHAVWMIQRMRARRRRRGPDYDGSRWPRSRPAPRSSMT